MVLWQPLRRDGPFKTSTGKRHCLFCVCWLALQRHALSSPLLQDCEKTPLWASGSTGATQAPENSSADAKGLVGSSSEITRDSLATASTPEALARQLQLSEAPYPFFEVAPYANVVTFDSHDSNCDRNFESPPITDPDQAGYPMDGTDVLRKREMACGIAQARFVFTTGDHYEYTDPAITALVQLRIDCTLAEFIESDRCEDLLDATGNFPRVDGCRFMGHEARLILATRLQPRQKYSVTVKLILPPGEHTASANSFQLTTELYQVKVIEGTKAPVDLTFTVPNAKDESVYNELEDTYDKRGYITSFTWQPETGFYTPTPGEKTKFTFGLRTFGLMGYSSKTYAIDFIAYPTDVWILGAADDECEQYSASFVKTTCTLIKVDGVASDQANGFRIRIGSTPFRNLDSKEVFSMVFRNPLTPVNMHWTATSFRLTSNLLPREPYTVFLDRPISVLGAAVGRIANWELASINEEQWVTLEFSPGNTVQPSATGISGVLVIIPPDDFTVVDSAAPQPDSVEYNALPCSTWPVSDQRDGRWLCTLEDNTVFQETIYRVRLRVVNPPTPGAARSWRVELWQEGAVKPLAITRGIRGMRVSGRMSASVAPMNQLLGKDNLLRFDFMPSQDVGTVAGTRLEVTAPEGFMIIKRCLEFERIELPECECRGEDGNGFDLVFTEPDVIKAGVLYIFRIQVLNPSSNIADGDNFWQFQTVRPDGIPIDTTRYAGFFLYPYDFVSLDVVPVSRRAGVQLMIVRFIAGIRIEFDDYIRIRAPQSVAWYAADLQFDSSSTATDAWDLGTHNPRVIFETPNVLEFQLTTAAEANIEYGISAQIDVPPDTPVPNRWWVEHYRQTGNPAPNDWRYIASSGAEGFKTQSLVNAQITPFNIVEEGWQNPTLVVFETTLAVEPTTKRTAVGTETVPAEVFLEAPAGFTYICPLTETVYMPDYTQNVPPNECVVNHNSEQDRNELSLYFDGGLEANVRYAFTIDLVNSQFIDLARNTFTLATRLDGVVIEDVVLDGFRLAKRMDNTRFWPNANREDRIVEASGNQVSFIIGTIMEVTEDTILEVKAPRGFRFALDCTTDVGEAFWIPNMLRLPTVEFCQNLERVSIDLANMAHITMTGTWAIGSYGVYVTVSNPMFTPARNFWGFTLYSRSMIPLMSEAWVYGFEIQVVHDPVFFPYNAGNGVDGEAAINRVEVTFSLTTRIAPDPLYKHQLVLTAPQGFRFPNVCRDFTTNVGDPDVAALPVDTECQGNGATRLTLTFPFMRTLLNSTRYGFRFLVINPRETFTETNTERWWWRMETFRGDGQLVDLNRVIPSFAVHHRLGYFKVDTLSEVGLNSTILRFHFRTAAPLPAQQTVHVYPPEGTKFYGLRDGICTDEDPNILARLFPEPLISGVTILPEWVSCRVAGPEEVVLQNTEPALGGRPLLDGPVFEFFVKNVTNAESTPALNLFRILARTEQTSGREVWTAEGWVIYSELMRTVVTSSNPGYGLYTNFTLSTQIVTEVPELGSFRIIAPEDYYFGPVLYTDETRYDPLAAVPPPQGSVEIRPPPTEVVECSVLRVESWNCPFAFTSCVDKEYYEELQSLGVDLTFDQIDAQIIADRQCGDEEDVCDTGALSDLISCQSMANELILTLKPGVFVPNRRIFMVLVQGYNARNPPANAEANTWHFMTRNSDSEKTILDDKPGVPGLDLLGIVHVTSIVPSDTKVGSIENYVRVTLVLSTPCDPRAVLRIIYPLEFKRNENAAFQGNPVEAGPNFPRLVETRISLNVIELEALEETIQANVPIQITISVSNPDISPVRAVNIWQFEAFSKATGDSVLLNCHYNVSGFKIFGEFSAAYITGVVVAPGKQNIIGAWFVLKSPLELTPTSAMRIWMPKGYKPYPNCGEPDLTPDSPDELLFRLEYNPNRVGVNNQFPSTVNYFPLPSGTECEDRYDEYSGLYYIELLISRGGALDYGLDYAFEFGVINPEVDPEDNTWRFETLMQGVILHLRMPIPGFSLEQLREVRITPAFTTSLLTVNRMEFYIMSDKGISGGSKIRITAPSNFVFTCAFFRTDEGLASTTTCYVAFTTPNVAEFVLDVQDPKLPLTPFRLFVTVSNPEFTPQENFWSFAIIDSFGKTFDTRSRVQGFDITGVIKAEIHPLFAYLGERNPLDVVFLQSTILNQAEIGNELQLTAPFGYIFPENCTEFGLRLTNERDALPASTSSSLGLGGAEYPNQFTFPPAGITCTGYGNQTVTIRMPDGRGLLKNNYTLRVAVENPGYVPNVTDDWTFITRVRPPQGGQRIVDSNTQVRGFQLLELVPLRIDEGAAHPLLALGSGLWLSVLVLAAQHAAAG